MRIKCCICDKFVSNEVPDDFSITVWVECLKCHRNKHNCKVAKWYSISVNEAQLRCMDCDKILGTAPAILNNNLVELSAFSHNFK